MRRIFRTVTLFFVALTILAAPHASLGQISVGVSISIGPPALPVYVQPPCPGPRFMWIPGYWAWATNSYYWVPGTWVLAPRPDLLWTPGYWGWRAGFYVWHPGYWGRRVGYYGGINYGFGYTGYGYAGGYWQRGAFFYNRSVNNIDVNVIRNTYYRAVVRNVTENRASYNGGPGGITLRPTRAQRTYARERHYGLTRAQELHERTARGIPALRASVNRGRPMIAATQRPGVFHGRGVVPAARLGGRYLPRMSPMRPERRFSAPSQRPHVRNEHPGSRRNLFQHPQPANARSDHFRPGPARFRPGPARNGRNPDRRRLPQAAGRHENRRPQNGRQPDRRRKRENRRKGNGHGAP